MIGKRPYSTSHSARDSWIAAIFTMGEGYHNYHHEFQWDYRNGVKPWQLDPSKWIIWTLSKLGMTSELKRVPRERILLAETKETKKQLNTQISIFQDSITESANELVEQALSTLEDLSERLTEVTNELQEAAKTKINLSKTKIQTLRSEVRAVLDEIESVGKIMPA
jgi:stearoyl-CoA desaturase (delta-9 desaturase)